MIRRNQPTLVALVVAVGLVVGCSSPTPTPPPEPPLTPHSAKEALLEMMRSDAGQQVSWFRGDVPDEMAKLGIEQEEGGWYAWTAAYRFHPATGVYTFVVRPRPGARACAFEYRGSFVRKGDGWAATPPEPVTTALQPGE